MGSVGSTAAILVKLVPLEPVAPGERVGLEGTVVLAEEAVQGGRRVGARERPSPPLPRPTRPGVCGPTPPRSRRAPYPSASAPVLPLAYVKLLPDHVYIIYITYPQQRAPRPRLRTRTVPPSRARAGASAMRYSSSGPVLPTDIIGCFRLWGLEARAGAGEFDGACSDMSALDGGPSPLPGLLPIRDVTLRHRSDKRRCSSRHQTLPQTRPSAPPPLPRCIRARRAPRQGPYENPRARAGSYSFCISGYVLSTRICRRPAGPGPGTKEAGRRGEEVGCRGGVAPWRSATAGEVRNGGHTCHERRL